MAWEGREARVLSSDGPRSGSIKLLATGSLMAREMAKARGDRTANAEVEQRTRLSSRLAIQTGRGRCEEERKDWQVGRGDVKIVAVGNGGNGWECARRGRENDVWGVERRVGGRH
jgi:hypothetical protein